MKFKLEIELGNDAMQTPEDVADALEAVASKLKNTGRHEGVVFDLSKCTIDGDEVPQGEIYGGHDFGWSAPAANVVGVVYKDQYMRDVLYVYQAEQAAEVPVEVQAQKMLRMGGSECVWFADPANPEGIRELGKHGLRIVEAVNAVLYGIDAVNSLIEGERLFVSSKLRELLDVTAAYAYGEDGIKPVKENDHLPDALRYLVASVVSKNLMEVHSGQAVAA